MVADLQSANGTFVNEKRIATVELAARRQDPHRLDRDRADRRATCRRRELPRRSGRTTTSLSIVETRSQTLVQRAVDPTKLEFLSQIYKRKDEADAAASRRRST